MAIEDHERFAKAKAVSDRLLPAGATECMLVGGFVRDLLLGIESKDVDLEVYGISYERIVEALSPFHQVQIVGKSFGIVKVDNEIDVGIPRRESKSGLGHKGFTVEPDPAMTPREAAARRDFTINSMAMRFNGEIHDPFGGLQDLKRKVLRATSPAFREDPLRVLRGIQFAARFGLRMDEDTVRACRSMTAEFEHLPKDRIGEEWQKWATKGRRPSLGLTVLQETGWLVHFPALQQLGEIPQDPLWHPEGNVFVHTAHVCDAAADIADREGLGTNERAIVLFAALCHDLGKAGTTVRNAQGRWVSHGHSERGRDLAGRFLRGIRAPNWLTEPVLPLVAEHMAYFQHPRGQKPSARAVRRLAHRLAPATIRLWSALCEADASGRPPRPKGNPTAGWEDVAKELGLLNARPQPVLMGRHLLARGYKPGRGMGDILQAAFEAQLEGQFRNADEGLAWVLQYHPLTA